MQLEFDADEAAVISGAATAFARLAPIQRFRSDGGPSVWTTLAREGWGSLGASVADGTLTLGVAGAVCREAGRYALIEELVTSGFILSSMVNRLPDDLRDPFEARLRLYPGVLVGDGRQPGLAAASKEHDRSVVFGAEGSFDLYRVEAVDGGAYCLGRIDLADRSEGVQVERLGGLSWSVATVEVPPDGWTVARLDLSDRDLLALEEQAMLLHSAALIGASERLLEMTRMHVLSRVQFGRPIGRFQAVKHALVDVLAANEVAWSALLCALAEDGGDHRRNLVARILCVEAAMSCARAAAQYQGAFGFSWEADTHIFLKAIVDGCQRFGSVNAVARRLGEEVVGAAC